QAIGVVPKLRRWSIRKLPNPTNDILLIVSPHEQGMLSVRGQIEIYLGNVSVPSHGGRSIETKAGRIQSQRSATIAYSEIVGRIPSGSIDKNSQPHWINANRKKTVYVFCR